MRAGGPPGRSEPTTAELAHGRREGGAGPSPFGSARHTRRTQRWQGLLIVLVMVPFWTSFLIRTYAWMSILASNGVINSLLRGAGVVDQPVQLLYTVAAVVVVLVGLGTLGFVGMIVAYAMLHAPPPHVATGADANAGGADGG